MVEGESEGFIFPIVIFTVLNILFFVTLTVFVARASTGVYVYEQGYAKEIALILDNLKPGADSVIDLSEGVEIAKDLRDMKSASDAEITGKLVLIDQLTNTVTVSLGGKTGYSFQYFSNCDIVRRVEGPRIGLTCKKVKTQTGAGGSTP